MPKKHGESSLKDTGKESKEYSTWVAIKQRCTNPKVQKWHRYGGRGISVCSRWIDSFEDFLEDMGRAPSKAHSIDRIDNDGDYCPENCRWATSKEQHANFSTNRKLTFCGKTKTLQEWSEQLGINRSTLCSRLSSGMSVDEAFTKPLSGIDLKQIFYKGQTKCLKQWAAEMGLSYKLVHQRLKNGKPLEKVFFVKGPRT